MSFRTKVLLSITGAVIVAVWLVSYLVSSRITRLYEQRESKRASDLVNAFNREFRSRGENIATRVSAIAASNSVIRMASQLADPAADVSQFLNDAEYAAREHSLGLLEFVGPDGSIISSAHWPARFGYREDWLLQTRINWNATPVFLKKEDLATGPVLALLAVRTVPSGGRSLFVAGGVPVDAKFLETLPTVEGMRIALWRDDEDPRATAPALVRLAKETQLHGREQTRVVHTTAGEEVATAIPLTGFDKQVHAVLFAIQNRSELVGLTRGVQRTALFVGAAAVGLGLLLGFWAASRVTRPVRQLAASVREVTAGDWTTRAQVSSSDEVGQLAADFNKMTEQLVDQRNRMLQAERVAAWREIARRLAHELKNPLFPLQITVENLRRARESAPEEFEEVFNESTSTLLAELANLKSIIGRFGDFARMPPPHFEAVDMNEIVRETMRLLQAQVATPQGPPITTHIELAHDLPKVQADPDQLRRALRNLTLNALDAMPKGGKLTVRTARRNGRVIIEVADTGEGLTPEEKARLFTPYYTTKLHGTGLGLAIVQSVVSDHGGAIAVDSAAGQGSVFRIELNA